MTLGGLFFQSPDLQILSSAVAMTVPAPEPPAIPNFNQVAATAGMSQGPEERVIHITSHRESPVVQVRACVTLGGSNSTGKPFTVPITNFEVTLSQYGRPAECVINTSLSRLDFDIITLAEYGLTEAKKVFSKGPNPAPPPDKKSMTLATIFSNAVPVDVWIGYLSADQAIAWDADKPDAKAPSSYKMTHLFSGILETVDITLETDEVAIHARDRAIFLQELRIAQTYPTNANPAQIAAAIITQINKEAGHSGIGSAKNYFNGIIDYNYQFRKSGLPLLPGHPGVSGLPNLGTYFSDRKQLMARGVRAWDLLLDMGRQIGFDLWMDGNTLHFQESQPYLTLPPMVFTWGQNVKRAQVTYNPFHSKDFKVVVYGYHQKTSGSSTATCYALGQISQAEGGTTQGGLFSVTGIGTGGGVGNPNQVYSELDEGKKIIPIQVSGAYTPQELNNLATNAAWDIARKLFVVTVATSGIQNMNNVKYKIQLVAPRSPVNPTPVDQRHLVGWYGFSGKDLIATRIVHKYDPANTGIGWETEVTAEFLPKTITIQGINATILADQPTVAA